MKLTLDPGAAALLDALHAAGYAAYAVGGCVRDSLLGRTAHDWDLCTSALPQQVMELFGTEQCIPTGLQHGTVTIKYGGQLYETTTFRTEGSYTDGRHPDEVQFVPDVREDLARRDFTINAMAYNAAEGLVDPFGGQKDLQGGLLRAVGEPQQRFTEDALRILRLYRFAARFGFALDAATARAARQLAPHLDCISAERIQEELAKLLAAPQPGAYLEPAVLAVVLPELTPESLTAAKPVVDACPAGEENLPVRWAALLGALGETDTRRVLKRLRCSNACIEETAVLVRETAGEGVCRSFSEDRPLGWDPAAAGSRAGDGMARFVSEEKATGIPPSQRVPVKAYSALGASSAGFSPFLLTSADTFSTSSGSMARARSTLLEPSVSWMVRTQPSLITRNATGWMLTPAPEPPPNRSLLAAFLPSKSVPPEAKPKLTLDTGRMVVPSSVVIALPMMVLASTISWILSMVTFIMP